MAEKHLDTSLLDKAIAYAVQAHAGTERRGKGFPYIVHPLEAVAVVATISPDQELLAAAALHDVVEDTDCTIDDIRREFGDRVAHLVACESEDKLPHLDKRDSWRQRKQAAIDRLAHASRDAKIVAMGDKLSNMRCIAADYEQLGDHLWQRFHAPGGRADHEWHYRSLADALFELASTRAFREFVQLIDSVFGTDGDLLEPRPIDMADYEQSGDGYTAVTYDHRDGHTMIKLYNDFMPSDAPLRELKLARAVVRMGIPTPMAGRLVTDGKRIGAEFERIAPKLSFARAIGQQPDRLEEYAHRFAAHCRQLHHTECSCAQFSSAAEAAIRAIEACPHFSDVEKQRMFAFVNAVPEATTCLHGDMHIGNIITNGERDYWIDLGDFGWGNPLFDLGMFYMAARCNPDELTQHLYHISNDQMRQVWDIFVRDYFGTDDHEEIEAREREIRPFAALRMIYYGTIDQMRPPMLAFIRENLLA